jgi:hypothetical protein
MKKNIIISLLIIFSTSFIGCSKEKKFVNTIQSKWDIDKTESYTVYCDGSRTLDNIGEDLGELILTNKLAEGISGYSTTKEQYLGEYAFNDGSKREFRYEYFQKLDEDMNVTFIEGGGSRSTVGTNILTKKVWNFSLNRYPDCPYNVTYYYLSK